MGSPVPRPVLSLPCWESHWPGTQAEQPQMQHISMPCLSFPIATNSLSVGVTFAKQRNSSTGSRHTVCLQPRGAFFPENR